MGEFINAAAGRQNGVNMANSSTTTPEYVDLFVPRGQMNDDPNEFISINGRNFLLPKGQISKVPAYVKDEYDRSQRALAALYAKSDALLQKASAPINQ